MSLLDVKDLSVEFVTRRGTLKAIHEISFSLERGEILGVVGESGAGKSLTGSAIIGLIDAPGRMSGGEIYLSNQRIDNLSEEAKRLLRGKKIAMVFQDPLTSLNPLFTIGAQLVETILLHRTQDVKEAEKIALNLLQEVGIPAASERFHAYPHQFSGGQRQRIVVALALCAEPEVLIADEPTTALDVSVQAQIMALLKKLCRERGTAVMLITHDLGVIAETADRVCVMYAGRIAEIGKVDEVINSPRHPYTQGLMGAIPSLTQNLDRLTQINGSMPRLNALPQGCAFHPRCPQKMERCHTHLPQSFAGVACHLYGGEA